MDHRPSDLDPYPRVGRDLATLELWDQSLERSQQRRRLEAASRSHRQRRKGTSIAVGAAMLAAPVVPAFAGVSRGGSPKGASGQGGRADTPVDTSSLAAATGGRTELLRFGDVGPAVTAIQRQVGVTADGIFGPITRGAVERFQRDHGLGMTGVVDARTWAALFNGRVLFYDAPGSRGLPPSGGGGAAGLGAPRGGPERVGGAGVAGRDGRGVVGRRRRRLVSGVVGVVGSGLFFFFYGGRLRVVGPLGRSAESGSGSGGSAPQSSAPAPSKRARPAPKRASRAHRAGADDVGGRLHRRPDRLAGERRDADGPLRRVPPRAPPRGRRPRRRERHADPRGAVRHGRAVRRRAGLRPDGLHPPRRRGHDVLRPHVAHRGDREPAGRRPARSSATSGAPATARARTCTSRCAAAGRRSTRPRT